MSFGPGTGIFLKLSGLFVKVHSWACVKMFLNSKLSGSNGASSASFKLKKQKDPPLHESNCVSKWRRRRKLLLIWVLSILILATILFLFSFQDRALGRKVKTSDHSCEEKAQILLQHFNVSKTQLHALVSMFYESDQITSIECTKQMGPKKAINEEIACALKLLCEPQGKMTAEDSESSYQCPAQESLIDELNLLRKRGVEECAENHCNVLPLSLVKVYWWIPIAIILICISSDFHLIFWRTKKLKPIHLEAVKQQELSPTPPKVPGNWRKIVLTVFLPGNWRKIVLTVFLVGGIIFSVIIYWRMSEEFYSKREETLNNMCDERSRMLQDQFNVSMNHVHSLAILVSTFHHGKNPSAIDQRTFSEYTEWTNFERPLTSGVAYALKVVHSEREEFEKRHGWTIRKMETDDQSRVQDCIPEKLDPAPIQDEYAPVIFSQETVSHIVSIDMMSGKEDRENILRARASGKGVLTSPFKLLKSNHVGVVLTFAVYDRRLPLGTTPEERVKATVGYLGASYDMPSLVEKLLDQLASKETIVVNVYDTTNISSPIVMYGGDFVDTGLLRINYLDFGDPLRKHEMHCRFKDKAPLPEAAISYSLGCLVIVLLVSHIFRGAIIQIAKVEKDFSQMKELKARAEAADVAKSQFLATVSHEIRTPMNGVLGMLQMLMNTDLNVIQLDYAQTAHNSGKELISLINEVLDQAKIESGRLELEAVPFDLRSVLDNVLSLFSGKSSERGMELAVYVSEQVPEVVIGDPGRFRQIITNLVGNSVKFTREEGHILVSIHLADEVESPLGVKDALLQQSLNLMEDMDKEMDNTLSGFPVVDRWKSWEDLKKLNSDTMEEPEMIRLLVTVEDTGVGIPWDAQSRIFTPFMQADSSTSRTYGGTGIGLSISKCLVDLMGGEIGFVSEPGVGSTFSFTASFREGKLNALDKNWQPYDPNLLEFRGQRALVIDNRRVRAEVTRYHLQRLGIAVDRASSLESAFSYLSGTSAPPNWSMILIDKEAWDKESSIAFPNLLKESKYNNGGTEILPKIFILATTITPDEREELLSSCLEDDIVIKPLRLSVLVASFQEAMGSGKKSQISRKKPTGLQNLLRGKRILVVDDNKVNRRVAEGALKKYGAIVTCVESGKKAMELLQPPHHFDACFMDRHMPEMDGFEATRQIRSRERLYNEQMASNDMHGNGKHWHTPILAMTADVMQATNEECRKCGMDDYVSKPFEEEKLYNAVARFFESS